MPLLLVAVLLVLPGPAWAEVPSCGGAAPSPPLQASVGIASQLATAAPPDRASLQLAFARALVDLDLHASAAHALRDLASEGPETPCFAEALVALVGEARVTADFTDVTDIAARLAPDRFPEAVRDELHYRVGVRLVESGGLTVGLEYLGHVDARSDRFLRARYVSGVALNERGEGASARAAFQAILDAPRGAVPAVERADLRALATMGIGRIAFAEDQFDEAEAAYVLVPRSSRRSGRALYEGAWSLFLSAGLDGTVERDLHALGGAAGRGTYLPERPIFEAILLLAESRYTEVAPVLDGFDATWQPAHAELATALAGDEVEVYHRYFGDGPPPPGLPPTLLDELQRDTELTGLRSHLARIRAEEARIDRMPREWRETVAQPLHSALEEDRGRLEARAAAVLRGRMAREAAHIKSLLRMAEVARFEVVDFWLHDLTRANTVISCTLGETRAQLRADAARNRMLHSRTPADLRAEAITRLRTLIASEPAHSEARADLQFRLSEHLREAGTSPERIALLEIILADRPTYFRADEVRYHLAVTLARRGEAGDGDRAEALLEQIVEAAADTPTKAYAWLLLGDRRFERGDFEQARAAYEQTVRLAPQAERDFEVRYAVAFARYKLAWCQWARGDHAGTIAALREVLPALGPYADVAARADLAKMEAAERASHAP